MKRRNFLKFLAGLPALALLPWKNSFGTTREAEGRYVSLLDARFQRFWDELAIESEPILFDPDDGEYLHLDWPHE